MKLWKKLFGTADSVVPAVATRSSTAIEQDRLGDELFARVSIAASKNPNMGNGRELLVRKLPANGGVFSVIVRLKDSAGTHTAMQFNVNLAENKLYSTYGYNVRSDFTVDAFEAMVEEACDKVRVFT